MRTNAHNAQWSDPVPVPGFPLGWTHMERTAGPAAGSNGQKRITPKWSSPCGMHFRSRVAALRFLEGIENGSIGTEQKRRYRTKRKRRARGVPRRGASGDCAARPSTVAPHKDSEGGGVGSEQSGGDAFDADQLRGWAASRVQKRKRFDSVNAARFIAIEPRPNAVPLRAVPGHTELVVPGAAASAAAAGSGTAIAPRVVRRRGRPLYI